MPIPGPPPGFSGKVLLDDGTGTFPYDISSYVRLVDGLNWQRGRGDEHSENQVGTLSLTLDNTDGRFTLGSTSGGYGTISNDRLVRFKVTSPVTVTRMTAAVQDWPVSWPGGGDGFCVVTLAATDALASLARQSPLLGSTDQEILRDSPRGSFPMQEASEKTAASDGSGNNRPPIYLGSGPGTIAPVFGFDMRLPDGSTGAVWNGDGVRTCHSITAASALPPFTTGSALSVTFVMLGTAVISLIFDTGAGAGVTQATIQVTASGVTVPLTSAVGSATMTDGQPHVVSVQIDATSTDVWIDAVKQVGAGFAGTFGDPQPNFTQSIVLPAGDVCAVSRLSYKLARLPDARIAAYHAAILADFAGETPAQRVARLFTYVSGGYTTGTIDAVGDTVLGPATQAGRSILDALNDAVDADFGDAYIDANGKLSTVAGTSIVGRVTPTATIDANWLGEDTTVTCDMFGVVNIATGIGTKPDAQTFIASDTVSISGDGTTVHPPHGKYPQSYTWNVNSDGQALARARWVTNVYSQPQPRLPSVTIDLLTADVATRTALLALDLTSLLKVTGLPAQTPGGTTISAIVEGITETISTTAWSLTLTLSMKTLRSAWVVGDPTYGVVGVTTRPYI